MGRDSFGQEDRPERKEIQADRFWQIQSFSSQERSKTALHCFTLPFGKQLSQKVNKWANANKKKAAPGGAKKQQAAQKKK